MARAIGLAGNQPPNIDNNRAGNPGSNHKEEPQDQKRGQDQNAILGGLVVGVLDVGFEELKIALVGFPDDVKEIAEERDVAEEPVDANVGQHAPEGSGGEFPAAGFEEDVAGESEARDVAEAGEETEEGVEADAELGAGDGDRVVEEVADLADLAEAIGAGFGGEHGGLG
jgi:hypothetical protein